MLILSVASTIMSKFLKISLTLSSLIKLLYLIILVWLFIFFNLLNALSTFENPMSSSLKITCLGRFDNSTLSPSTIPTVPIPEEIKYGRTADPKPPTPTTSTFDFSILA